jgi:hypothetical protein
LAVVESAQRISEPRNADAQHPHGRTRTAHGGSGSFSREDGAGTRQPVGDPDTPPSRVGNLLLAWPSGFSVARCPCEPRTTGCRGLPRTDSGRPSRLIACPARAAGRCPS